MSARDLLDSLVDAAADAAGNLSVSVKTNLGPEITVWSGAADGGTGGGASSPSLAERLGIRAAVIVRGSRGQVLKEFGDYPATEPWKVALALLAAGALLFVIVRGVWPR